MTQNPATPFHYLPLPIAIVGMAVTGEAISSLLQFCNVARADLIHFDQKIQSADYHEGDRLMTERNPQTLVVSPGVPLNTPWIQTAIQNGCLITSELNLAYELLTPQEKVIAITGSIGKSTTTCLIGEGLKSYLPDCFIGGNLGIPLAQYVLEKLKGQRAAAPWIALELSSYQLENFNKLKAEYSIFTYFTANHLERYPNKNAYYQTKWNLISQTQNTLIFNQNGGELMEWLKSHPVEKLQFTLADRKSLVMKKYYLEKSKLLGAHNLDNIAVAATLLELLKAPPLAFQKLCEFAGLSHRVENLGWIDGVRYVNDSKATTIESVLTAIKSTLESIDQNQKLWVLLGGRDKNLPWQELQPLAHTTQLKFIFFGECATKAQTLSGLPGLVLANLKLAVKATQHEIQNGDTVLLSPGGTSLDEFKNFEMRGEKFKDYIRQI